MQFLAKLIVGFSGWHVLVSRYADVLEVLGNDEVFSVEEYGRRMNETVGTFFLGMDAGEEYRRQWDLARQALYVTNRAGRDTLTRRVRELANRLSRDRIGDHRPSGEIEVVEHLARAVPIELVEELFGITDTPEPSIFENCFMFSRYIFFGWPYVPRLLRRSAVKAGRAFCAEIATQVNNRIDSGEERDDVLGRLIQAQQPAPNREMTRNIMIGLVSGATVATGLLFSSLVDRMMDFPADWLQRLQGAAARATRSGKGDAELTRFVREAARFAPQPPYPYRRCTREYVLAEGTERERTLGPHTIVVLAVGGAGADGHMYEDPKLFRLDRPQESYLLFGYGLHACVGRFIGEIVLEEMTAALFSLPLLRRDGKHGRLPMALRKPRLVLKFAPARDDA